MVIEANLENPAHALAILDILDSYSRDPMADGKPLADDVRRELIPRLKEFPPTFVLLAFLDDAAIGLAICFQGFSTFAARPLLNVHDLAVLPAYRGQGVGRALLQAVEEKAWELGCCKVTLEVLEKNSVAKRLYDRCGYAQAEYGGEAGKALFMCKSL